MPLISLTDAQHSFLPSILPRCAGTTLNVCDWREMLRCMVRKRREWEGGGFACVNILFHLQVLEGLQGGGW